MCRRQEWQYSLSYLLNYFPLMVSDAISCPIYNLNGLGIRIIIILGSYDKHVLTMCGVQEWQVSSLYFLSYLPMMVKAIMPTILNTVRYIFMRLYGCVEVVVTMSHIKIWWLLCSYSSPPPPTHTHTNPGFGFFVEIYLLESSKLDL